VRLDLRRRFGKRGFASGYLLVASCPAATLKSVSIDALIFNNLKREDEK